MVAIQEALGARLVDLPRAAPDQSPARNRVLAGVRQVPRRWKGGEMTTPALPESKRVRASEIVDPVGFVYFLGNAESSTVKIGFTRSLRKRVSVLQTGNHSQLEVFACIRAHPHIERAIHSALSRFKIRNEWYDHDACVDDLLRKIEDYEIEVGVITKDFSTLITDEAISIILKRWERDWLVDKPCGDREKA
ncbi:hypothetical protein EVC14_027 [Rhizobium phage RHph_I3_18]|nr:hypothetical protein EVC14_027 [Rhizobium phage RHph_I3_18]